MVTFEDVKNNKEINTCIKRGNDMLGVIGYTDHSFVHAMKVSATAARILEEIGGYTEREIELARIAGYIHDIGNMVNRDDHAQTGALLAYNILMRMGMDVEEVTMIAGAVGNHDEGTGNAVSPVSAALILADKSDVRRSRVRRTENLNFDIHDRVNFAVQSSEVVVKNDENRIYLEMMIDTDISSVVDYFEIFLTRMIMCKKSAEFLGRKLRIMVNGSKLL